MDKNMNKNMDKKLIRLSCGLIFISCLMLLALGLGGCGSAKADLSLTLTPAGLSADTQMLARNLGLQNDVQLFDYQLTGAEADRSQSLALEIWRYEDGRWLKQVGTMLEVQQEDSVLLVNSDEGFGVMAGYLMNRTGGYYCATEVWRIDSDHTWWTNAQMEQVTLKPGEETLLRAQAEITDDEETAITPGFRQESFREDLAIEGCVVLTATFNVAE